MQNNPAQPSHPAVTKQIEDERVIRQIVQDLEDAWNAHDSMAWSNHVADDIFHTVWNGHFVEGKDAVTAGHEALFNTIYKGTRQKFTVRWVRFLRPDVAAVQFDGEFTGKQGISEVRPLAVLTKQDGHWLIEIFQNTPILPHPAAVENGNGRSS